MQPMMPGPEHARLEPFAGTFRAEVKLWIGPGDPLVSTGTMTNTWDLGGRYLRQDYVGDPSPGPFDAFAGRGFWGYNTVAGRYEGFWVDNASTMMQLETGQVDGSGKVWTMSSRIPDPASGPPMDKRSVITLEDRDHHRLEMDFEKDGRRQRAMEIRYTRA